jgi:hypothetical protein
MNTSTVENEVKDNEELPLYSEDGVDLTLIRWMLSLTPLERLQTLQQYLKSMQQLRDANPTL